MLFKLSSVIKIDIINDTIGVFCLAGNWGVAVRMRPSTDAATLQTIPEQDDPHTSRV
jgi:hypothetical protein